MSHNLARIIVRPGTELHCPLACQHQCRCFLPPLISYIILHRQRRPYHIIVTSLRPPACRHQCRRWSRSAEHWSGSPAQIGVATHFVEFASIHSTTGGAGQQLAVLQAGSLQTSNWQSCRLAVLQRHQCTPTCSHMHLSPLTPPCVLASPSCTDTCDCPHSHSTSRRSSCAGLSCLH